MLQLRKENLELREYVNLVGTTRYEIVKWQPNGFYGKSKEDYPYINNIDEDLFKVKETCFTIAWFDFNEESKRWRKHNVSNRYKEMTKEEYNVFNELYIYLKKNA